MDINVLVKEFDNKNIDYDNNIIKKIAPSLESSTLYENDVKMVGGKFNELLNLIDEFYGKINNLIRSIPSSGYDNTLDKLQLLSSYVGRQYFNSNYSQSTIQKAALAAFNETKQEFEFFKSEYSKLVEDTAQKISGFYAAKSNYDQAIDEESRSNFENEMKVYKDNVKNRVTRLGNMIETMLNHLDKDGYRKS